MSILPDILDRVFIASFPAGPWQTNCYVLATGPRSECVIVDPGLGAAPGIADVVADQHLRPVAVLVSHGHLDHMFSVTPVCSAYAAIAWVHPADRALLADPLGAMPPGAAELLAQMTGGTASFTEPDEVRELSDGATVEVAGLRFDVGHAPGHTPGSVLFRTPYAERPEVDSLVFSGDVVFAGSIGRTDLPGGDDAAMRETLRTRVLPLPDSVVLLPGHGPQTTLGQERASNPYLSDQALSLTGSGG